MKQLPILVVDDSDFDRGLLVKALSKKGKFQTLEANSGEQCLRILEKQNVGLILMDILMPGASGSQVLLKIRERFNPIELPIIMVTSKADAKDVIECLQSGANDYITKPVHFEVAITRIKTHLQIAQLSKEMSRLKEMAALDAMITTYNHEINNPLTVAIGCLNSRLLTDEKAVKRLSAALWRVADVVKKIREITEKKEAEFSTYVGSSKMVKLK